MGLFGPKLSNHRPIGDGGGAHFRFPGPPWSSLLTAGLTSSVDMALLPNTSKPCGSQDGHIRLSSGLQASYEHRIQTPATREEDSCAADSPTGRRPLLKKFAAATGLKDFELPVPAPFGFQVEVFDQNWP